FAAFVLGFAMYTDSSIFKMVENAYKSTLVVAFVPLMAGFFWKSANRAGALVSMVGGALVWIAFEIIDPEGTVPPQLYGFAVAVIGMFVGSLLLKERAEPPAQPPAVSAE
ncbi:MAG: sodium:solute symporter, partial [Oxalobacter sp.]|nr:sodium:solute symporter [Oxalobacter sp.]